MNTAVVRHLRDVRMSDAAEVGGKAASLGELFAVGVSVPEGVVMTAEAAALTAPERRWGVANGAWDLGSGPFAVRSSGISEDGVDRSFAGMYETVLEVAPDDLGTAVERCLASARAARVTEYERGTSGRMAVIIQRMVAPVAAGVRVPEGVVMTSEDAALTAPERRWGVAKGAWDLGPGPISVR